MHVLKQMLDYVMSTAQFETLFKAIDVRAWKAFRRLSCLVFQDRLTSHLT